MAEFVAIAATPIMAKSGGDLQTNRILYYGL
jgi:hypothetical protein